MNAFRKLILASVAALVLFAPVAAPSPVQAAETHSQVAAKGRVYWVYYRSCPNDYWHLYGGYYKASDAQLVVRYFQYYGYQAFYR